MKLIQDDSMTRLALGNREPITAWVTTWALTKGILRKKGSVPHDICSKMFCFDTHGTAHGDNWHRTEAAAIARAEEMRLAKITSLKRQIAKLEKRRFAVGGAK